MTTTFIAHRESLLSGAQLAAGAVPKKDFKPALMNLKVVAGDGRFTLMGTDLEVGFVVEVQGVTIQSPGICLLPAAKLVSVLKEMGDAEITIESTDDTTTIRGKTVEFELPAGNPDDFPDFPQMDDESYHEVTAGSLREMIHRTVFATADETARYSMTGVLWEVRGDQVRLVATDGRRLAIAEGLGTQIGGHEAKGQPVVPTRAMSLLEKQVGEEDDEAPIRVRLNANEVFFRSGRAVLYSRLVEGKFPQYKDIIPRKCNVNLSLNVGMFLAAIKQAAIMTDAESSRVVCKFEEEHVTLSAQSVVNGRSKVEMTIEGGPAVPVTVNVNPNYVTEYLKVLPSDGEVEVAMTAPEDPKANVGTPVMMTGSETSKMMVMPLT